MSTFYKNLVRLCVERNVSPSGVASAIKLSNAAATGWKKGNIPNDTTKQKIAQYFGITVEELMSEKADKKKPVTDSDELTEQEVDFIKWFRSLPQEKRSAFRAVYDAPEKFRDWLESE